MLWFDERWRHKNSSKAISTASYRSPANWIHNSSSHSWRLCFSNFFCDSLRRELSRISADARILSLLLLLLLTLLCRDSLQLFVLSSCSERLLIASHFHCQPSSTKSWKLSPLITASECFIVSHYNWSCAREAIRERATAKREFQFAFLLALLVLVPGGPAALSFVYRHFSL